MSSGNPNSLRTGGHPSRLRVEPVLERPSKARFRFEGFVGDRISGNLENWLLTAPRANPAMLQMFRDRDREPRRELMAWSGEFPGKYLISAVQGYRLTPDKRLRALLDEFVADLVSVQDSDGYLGPHPRAERLTGTTCDGKGKLWDLWGHYHCMLGLLLWFEETGSEPALTACCKAADLLCRRFLEGGERMISAGAEEMNLAIIHVLCLLYQCTGEERYLKLAREVEKDWETPPAGDYVRMALAGKEFFQTPKPRWESLPDLQGIAELYFITGDPEYRRAFEHLWWSIVKLDRHNTGGFSSGEQAVGNPYNERAIETCCTIAWMALCVDMLRMTGDPVVADELELSTFNGALGAQTPSGRWWTYNTPMDGVRKASAHEIVFQAHQGAPDLNCCSVNGPRALGLLSEWAVMAAPDGVVLNYYGPSEITVASPGHRRVTLRQTTDYPQREEVLIQLGLSKPERFTLRLRIPHWSSKTLVSLNGRTMRAVQPGTYLDVDNDWRNGDTIRLTLDLTLRLWIGEREAARKASLYRGPLLLAYDQRYNTMDPDEVPTLNAHHLDYVFVPWNSWPAPWLLLRFRTIRGQEVLLCDYASAGSTGTVYRSWLPMTGAKPKAFTREHPRRCARIG